MTTTTSNYSYNSLNTSISTKLIILEWHYSAGELIIMQIGIVKVMGFAFAAEPVPGLGTVLSIKL